jgi:hypothetical protein
MRAWAACVGLCWIACGGEAYSPSLETRPARLSAGDPELLVSLTFDDTWKPQREAASILEAHGLSGTFYMNSPRLHEGTARPTVSNYMSITDALALQERGHEIGGHTLSHLPLASLPDAEQEREVDNDRRQLSRLGFEVRSLAYPDGDVENDSQPSEGRALPDIVREAGYSSARDTSGLGLNGCRPGAESLPPAEPYRVRSIRSISNVPPVRAGQAALPPDDAATLLGWMDNAASCGGGWLPLVFHHFREDCSAADAPARYCFQFSELDSLAAALAAGERCHDAEGQEACYRISVAPVSAALGVTELSPLPPEAFAARNSSLERTLASGNTECIQRTQATGGSISFARSTELAHSGQASERMQILEPYVGPAEITIKRDYGACAIFAGENQPYQLSLYYRAEPDGPLPTLRFVVYRLTQGYVWQEWSIGRAAPARSPGRWVLRSFLTRPVPADTLALSFGLRQESAGAVQVDDFAVAAAPAP